MNKSKNYAIFRRWRQLGFYLSIITLPLLQFMIFYIGVNVNSIVMAFQKYVGGKFVWAGIENFKQIFINFKMEPAMTSSLKNSFLLYLIVVLTMIAATFFAFYIYKKRALYGLFRVVLFLPHIISNITFVIIFKYFTENAYPSIAELFTGERPYGLISNPLTAKSTIIFFCVFIGFGTQMLMFTGAMSGISDSVSESASLDGISPLQEYRYITIPLIYPTLTTFIIVGVVGIFTNQMSLFSFFGVDADASLQTFGYMLYRGIKTANISGYSYLAALGIFFTLISVPLTFFVKWLLGKFDPMA